MRYYSTQRPITPGSFPRVAFTAVKEIVNFERKTYCEEIGREAWGYIDYEKPLDRYDCNAYELTAVPTKTLRLRYIGKDSWSRYVYEDEDGKLWKLTDCCSPREVCEQRGDTLHSACNNSFDGEPDCPMSAHINYIFVKEF